MKLKLEDFVFRSWNYFRHGYSTYLSFFVAFASYITVIYKLAIEDLSLEWIFPRFHVFIIFAVSLIVPLAVFMGWLHMKGTLAYPTDVAITVEANPYNYIVTPGKQKEALAPAQLLTLQALQKILEKENMLSPQEKMEFENLKDKFQKMLRGEVMGAPRQRKLLARLEKS